MAVFQHDTTREGTRVDSPMVATDGPHESAAVRRGETTREIEKSAKIVSGGYSVAAIAAAGGVVLTILGLAGVYPVWMAEIATIVVASALIIKAGGIAARFRKLRWETSSGSPASGELGTGMSAELLAGAAGITLGILALVDVASLTLLCVGIIVFGGALLFGGGETYRVSQLSDPTGTAHPRADSATRAFGETAGGAETLVGIGAITLGIIALTGVVPLTLVLVGLLSVAGADLLSGIAVSSRMGQY